LYNPTLNCNPNFNSDEEVFRYKMLDYVNTERDTDGKLYNLTLELLTGV
jgi:hypothetical protein